MSTRREIGLLTGCGARSARSSLAIPLLALFLTGMPVACQVAPSTSDLSELAAPAESAAAEPGDGTPASPQAEQPDEGVAPADSEAASGNDTGAGAAMIGPGPGAPSLPVPDCPDCKPMNVNELANVDVVLDCGDWDASAFEFELSGIEPSNLPINGANLLITPTFEEPCGNASPCNPFSTGSAPVPSWGTPAGGLRLRWVYDAINPTNHVVTASDPDPAHFGYSLEYTAGGQTAAKSNASVPVPHDMVARYYETDPDINPETQSCETVPISLALTWTNRFTGTLTIGASQAMIANVEVRTLDRPVELGELVAKGRALAGPPVRRYRYSLVPHVPASLDVPIDRRAQSVVLKTVWEPAGESVERDALRPRMTSYHAWNIEWTGDKGGVQGPTPGAPSDH